MTNRTLQNPVPLIVMGAGGHAKVLVALARAAGHEVIGVCDPELSRSRIAFWREIPVLGDDEAIYNLQFPAYGLINGIGQLVGSAGRRLFFERLCAAGFFFPPLIHPMAWVDDSAELGQGAQVMAGAIVQADAKIGMNSIINTGARVDHDCCVGNHVHIAPGAILCGNVTVGDGAFIASGSVVIQGLKVGEGAVLAAGAVLVRNLSDKQTSFGYSTRR
ncbi:acetyltransferase [Pseudomonas caspiana]|uniref:acetyltransferase n=1 Tax=Pseudomonas caspiana TaxID=1451454 RepID=UPI0032EAEF00